MTFISLQDVHKTYGHGQEALKGVSLCLAQGELAFLTGHSGAGKSTLLKLLAAIEQPTRGRIIVNEQSLSTLSTHQISLYRRHVGIIFQNPMLLPQHTVFENVALPLEIQNYTQTDIQKRVQAALNKVDLLRKAKVYPHQLSLGEQQRVGIARAVVHRPRLLLADEPTGNLDPHLSTEIMQLFARFQQVGVTIIIATHDQSVIADLPHPEYRLSHGQLYKAEIDA